MKGGKRMGYALVTGATRNLGLGIATRLAEEGYAVLVNGSRPDIVAEVARHLAEEGRAVVPCAADVADFTALRRAIDAGTGSGAVSVLVHCAVARSFGGVLEVDDENWGRCMDVAVNGARNALRCVLPGMREAGFGRVVNIIGRTGQAGAPGRVAVVTAKSALIGLTKAVAHDEAAYGITVNAVSPGPLDTVRGTDSAHYANDVLGIPVGRLGTTTEVAEMVNFLARKQSGFITGQIIGVNGGALM